MENFFHKIDGIKISITIKFTGLKTMTGGRIKALSKLLRDYKFFTYLWRWSR